MKLFTGDSYSSIILIALLWVIPITVLQARPSDNECFEKSRVLYDRYQFASQKYGRSPAAVARLNYAGALDRKRFYEGECSNSVNAAYNLEGAIKDLELARGFCIKEGLRSNCNLTSIDDYFSGFPGQEATSSNQNKKNKNSSPVKNLTNDQCNQKMSELDADSRDKSDGMNGDSVEYARIWYKTHLTVKNLLETECTQVVDANYALEARINYMNLMGERCAKKGAGSNCGITFAGVDSSSTTSSNNSSTNQNQTTYEAPPTKKLSAAEQKRQEAQQKADDLGTQSQQLAQENQSKADTARQGKRKRHDPAAEANHCIKPNSTDNNYYGSVTNTCNYDIYYTMCLYKPNEKSFHRNIACENQSFGADRIKANQKKPFYLKHSVKFYWFACKDPAWAVDSEFVEGRGMKGRCKDVGASD